MIPELNVPFLHDQAIEQAAHELLRRYAQRKGKPVRPPIDVENILEDFFELDITYVDLQDYFGVPDVLGAALLKARRILVDESLLDDGKEGRRMFTLAHECGHWQLHRPLVEGAEDAAPLEPQTILCLPSQRKTRAERQADRFAACLLMPAASMRAAVRAQYGHKLPKWEGVEEKYRAHELDENLRELAAEVIECGGFTNVSNEAMRYRLLDLKLVVDASAPQGRNF